MDTTRRGFFGTLAALMVAPKLTLASPSADVVEYEPADVHADVPAAAGSRVMLAAQIEDGPLRLSKVYGPITRISKPKTGVYTIEWTPPKDFVFHMAHVETLKNDLSPFAVVQDPTNGRLSVQTRDVCTFDLTNVETLSIMIILVSPKTIC